MELSKINNLDTLKALWVDIEQRLTAAREAAMNSFRTHEKTEATYDKLRVQIASGLDAEKNKRSTEPTKVEQKELDSLRFKLMEQDLDNRYDNHVIDELDNMKLAVGRKIRVLTLQKKHPDLDIDTVRKIAIDRNSYEQVRDAAKPEDNLGAYESTVVSDDIFKPYLASHSDDQHSAG